MKDATLQNEDQKYALLEYFSDALTTKPWIYRCLMLRGIESLPRLRGQFQPNAGAIASTFDATSLLVAVASVNGIPKHGQEYAISSGDPVLMDQVFADPLFSPIEPSNLDRKRMDRIAARPAEARELGKLAGVSRVHLRGNGGTGKTVLLLQSAFEAYHERGIRCLVLTYNTALAADLQRTLALMGIPSEGEGGGISIRTVMSFMYQWFAALGVATNEDSSFEKYGDQCAETLDYLDSGAVSEIDIKMAKTAAAFQLDYDAIFIDEAQDWPQHEADLLTRLYGGGAISLADGIAQLVRGNPTDWRSGVAGEPTTGSHHYKVGLRMKTNLCTFANAFAKEVGQQWFVEPNPRAAGGRVLFLYGKYENYADLQRELLANAIKDGNMPIDLLHCVPPSAIFEEDGRKQSTLAKVLRDERVWKTWDAVDEIVRRNFPRSREMFRVVQYESCRGLEGWITVLDGFDEFWENRCRIQASTADDVSDFADPESVAWRWCMIPLTRPIDTLVVCLRDKSSKVAQVMEALVSQLPDIVVRVDK